MKWILVCFFLFSSICLADSKNYCSDFLKSLGMLAHFQDFWSIKPDGTFYFDKEAHSRYIRANFRIDKDGSKIFISEKPLLIIGFEKRAYITLDEKKRIKEIIIKLGSEENEKKTDGYTRVTLDYKNGSCYPLEEKTAEDILFNTEMCHELLKYLETNPQSLDCKCGNDKTNKALKKILLKYGDQPYDRMDWEKPDGIKANETHKNQTALNELESMSQPLYQALNRISGCRAAPGVNKVLKDQEFWKIQSGEVLEKTDQHTIVK